MCTFGNIAKINHTLNHQTDSNKYQKTESHREYVLWPHFN